MFKGGTSLSKGWGLITRFSEDIDLFVNPDRYHPRPGKSKMDGTLKELSAAVAEHPALTWLTDEGRTIGGLGREDYFAYSSHFAELPGIRPVVDSSRGSKAAPSRPRSCRSRRWWRSSSRRRELARCGRRPGRLRRKFSVLRRRARARAGRHTAKLRIEVGGVRALHRVCPMQRHAAALTNGARSCRPLKAADRAAGRRSAARRRSPLMRVAARCGHRRP